MKASARFLTPLLILLSAQAFAQQPPQKINTTRKSTILCGTSVCHDPSEAFSDSILEMMTLDEKIGQLNQMHCEDGMLLEENARKGLVGSVMRYSDFKYSNLSLDKNEYQANDSIILTFNLENVGDVTGTEVTQVYIRDIHAGLTRPVKELIHFERIAMDANDSKRISFSIPVDKLGYWLGNEYIIEPGKFDIFVGGNSNDCLTATFNVI